MIVFLSSNDLVWSRSVEQQAVLAVLTLNVARFTNWPEQVINNIGFDLNLCVIGNNFVQNSFNNINNKVIHNKTVHVINISRLRNLDQCQLLYVSELQRSKLITLLAKLEGQPILTVGQSGEFLQTGGMVGLEKANGKIKLSINLTKVKQSGLVISSRLLKLANIVNLPISEN